MKTYKKIIETGRGLMEQNITIIGNKAYICQIHGDNGRYFEQAVNAKTGEPWQAQRNVEFFHSNKNKAMVYWLKQISQAKKVA